ncbi:MAG: trans-sulfuration enzyme family protein [bacterium JZ-2024 1]
MPGMSTTSIHGGEKKEEDAMHSVVPPLYQTASFYFEDLDSAAQAFTEKTAYVYSRLGNPTVDLLERRMALLEKGEQAVATSSGMAAISALLLYLLHAGDHLLASHQLYTSTYHLIKDHLPQLGIQTTLINLQNLENLDRHIQKNTRAIFLETPGNPLLDLIDIEAVAEIAHQHNPPIPVIVDNTFATSICQQPLLHKADFVVHSATKFLSGHGDTLGGLIIGSREHISAIKHKIVKNFGFVLSPFNTWLILRGLCTLEVRVKQETENARIIARFLSSHPKIRQVFYPEGPIAQKQMTLPGAMLAFNLDCDLQGVKKFLRSLKVCTLAVSLGDVRTLIQHPATMTHSSIPPEEHRLMNISESSIRMSVGLENYEDLLEDIENALKSI